MESSTNKTPIFDKFGRPLRDLRISVTDRCNFRCPYCMPKELFGERYQFLPKPELLNFEEISRITKILVGFGVNKVRLTGGEPLLRTNIEVLIKMLSEIDGIKDLTLTTNGSLLAKNARALRKAGLHRITVSIDSLDNSIFKQMNGNIQNIDRVLEGIQVAEKVGLTPIKINAVVQKGTNDHTIMALAQRFKGTGHIVRFIEFMDVGSLNNWNMDQVVPSIDVVEQINSVFPLEAIQPNYPGEVAERYKYKDGSGEIGVISSVTAPFCGNCTRVRLSPDGKLITCLFASTGFDLKELVRKDINDQELEQALTKLWTNRVDRYSEIRAALKGPQPKKIEMYQIGG